MKKLPRKSLPFALKNPLTMKIIDEEIRIYIEKNHVLSFTVSEDHEMWSANAFYACDLENNRILFLSNERTRHAKMMYRNSATAGTISDQNNDVKTLQGVQFSGDIYLLENEKMSDARKIYEAKYPFTQGGTEPIWELRFTHLKLTDNSKGFGNKQEWLSETE